MTPMPKPQKIRNQKYLKWIRRLFCAKCGNTKGGTFTIDASHQRQAGDAGKGQKPSDCFAIPLCKSKLQKSCHGTEHGINGGYVFTTDESLDQCLKYNMMYIQEHGTPFQKRAAVLLLGRFIKGEL